MSNSLCGYLIQFPKTKFCAQASSGLPLPYSTASQLFLAAVMRSRISIAAVSAAWFYLIVFNYWLSGGARVSKLRQSHIVGRKFGRVFGQDFHPKWLISWGNRLAPRSRDLNLAYWGRSCRLRGAGQHCAEIRNSLCDFRAFPGQKQEGRLF